MAQTYAQLQEQIARLQAEAQTLRKAELAQVVAQIRGDIKTYGITAQDLFGKALGKPQVGKSKSGAAAKYGDGKGNLWVGRGPRPQWLRDALAAGKRLEEFVFGEPKPEPPVVAPVKKAAVKQAPVKKGAVKKAAAKKQAAR